MIPEAQCERCAFYTDDLAEQGNQQVCSDCYYAELDYDEEYFNGADYQEQLECDWRMGAAKEANL